MIIEDFEKFMNETDNQPDDRVPENKKEERIPNNTPSTELKVSGMISPETRGSEKNPKLFTGIFDSSFSDDPDSIPEKTLKR